MHYLTFQPNDQILFPVFSHLTVVPVAANHPITTMFFPPTQLTASLSFCLFLFVKKYSLTKQNEPSRLAYLPTTSPALPRTVELDLPSHLRPHIPAPRPGHSHQDHQDQDSRFVQAGAAGKYGVHSMRRSHAWSCVGVGGERGEEE